MQNYITRNNNYDLLNESVFDDIFETIANTSFKNVLKTDIEENEKEYTITMDVPGLDKNDIKISLDNKYLKVEATYKEVKKEGKFHKKERFYEGSYSKSFYVGDVEQEAIKANVEKGVLVISISKEEMKKQEEKKYISIN